MIHCDISEWSLKVARELDTAVNSLFEDLVKRGYVRLLTMSPNPRFCEYMGGELVGKYTHEDKEYWGFRWELK